MVRGPVAACPRATRADRSASRRRMPPAFSIAAKARFSATGFPPLPARRADGSTTWRSVTTSGSRPASASRACTPHCEHSDPSTAQRIRMTDPLPLMTRRQTHTNHFRYQFCIACACDAKGIRKRISPIPRGCGENRYSGSYEECGVLQQRGTCHCGDSRQSIGLEGRKKPIQPCGGMSVAEGDVAELRESGSARMA